LSDLAIRANISLLLKVETVFTLPLHFLSLPLRRELDFDFGGEEFVFVAITEKTVTMDGSTICF
jgi:hypothetical protein